MAQNEAFHEQVLNNPVNLHPSLAGWHGGVGIYATSQQQFVGLDGRPETTGAAVDGYVDKLRTAFAVNVQRDRFGQLVFDKYQLVASPKIALGTKSTLMPSVAFNYHDLRIGSNWRMNSLNSTSSFNTSTGSSITAGLAFTHQNLFAAVTFHNLIRTSGEASPGTIMSMSAGYHFQVNDNWSITPTVNAQSNNYSSAYQLSATVRWKELFVTPHYTWKDRTGLALGVDLAERVRFSVLVSSRSTIEGGFSSTTYEAGFRALLFKDKAKRRFLKDLPVN